jgi:hypothetical protein
MRYRLLKDDRRTDGNWIVAEINASHLLSEDRLTNHPFR